MDRSPARKRILEFAYICRVGMGAAIDVRLKRERKYGGGQKPNQNRYPA